MTKSGRIIDEDMDNWTQLLNSFGPATLDDLIDTAFARHSVKKSRRPHIKKIIKEVIILGQEHIETYDTKKINNDTETEA